MYYSIITNFKLAILMMTNYLRFNYHNFNLRNYFSKYYDYTH